MHSRGDVLQETYRIEKSLAVSGEGYQATHLRLKSKVWVRPLLDFRSEPANTQERDARRRALRTTQARVEQVASLEHPALIDILDSFFCDEVFYVVCDAPQGLTVRELVARSLEPLTTTAVRDFAFQLFDLLETLQRASYVVKVVNPDNLVVDKSGRLTLIDPGFLVPEGQALQMDTYLAPEVLGGSETPDVRADLYSVGATLFFALTGSELPPIWDRITLSKAVPDPAELGLEIDEETWTSLEALLALGPDQRPSDPEHARKLFQRQPGEAGPRPSRADWYPEQSEQMLASSEPFRPFSSGDWILKMVQGGVVGRARELRLVQTREECRLDIRLAASDVPSPRQVLEGLSTEDVGELKLAPLVRELSTGLRMVGEFRDFHLVLDDWQHSWQLDCSGGSLVSSLGESTGKSGLRLRVRYQQENRAGQAADELLRLSRSTRLCPIPIFLDGRPLDVGRPTEPLTLPEEVVEFYLASISFPTEGEPQLQTSPDRRAPVELPMTGFGPECRSEIATHVDVRCYVAPGWKRTQGVTSLGYHFQRHPSRIFWYRHGVLCARQDLDTRFALQLDIHLEGDDLCLDGAGLVAELLPVPDQKMLASLRHLREVLPVTRFKLQEHWDENPGEGSPKLRAVGGMVATPLLVLTTAALAPWLLVKKLAAAAVLKSSAVLGGAAGYLSEDHTRALRRTCFRAIDTFLKEDQ